MKKGLIFIIILGLVGLAAYAFNDTLKQDFKDPSAVATHLHTPATASADEPVVKDFPNPFLLKPGTVAPDLALTGTDGNFYSLESYRGKQMVFLEFFSATCPHCQKMVPKIKEIAAKHPELQILAVNAGDHPGEPSTSQGFARQYDVHYPILDQPTKALVEQYQIRGFPTFYLVDKSGKIVWAKSGEIRPENQADMEKLLTP